MHQTKSMYVTNVEKEGPFLKIWGQTDKKSALEVEQALLRASERFEEGKYKLNPNAIDVGTMCCAKYIDGKYYRARVTSTLTDGLVEINFLDYGNKDSVSISNLRSLDCFNTVFTNLPPLSSPFILADVVCLGGEWNENIINQIAKDIRYIEASIIIVAQAVRYYLIKMFIRDIDLGTHLVRQNLMQSTSVQTQEAVLLAMIPRTPLPVPQQNQSLLQFRSVTLEPNTKHEVYVSYITDGPCHFSVQLKKYESDLAQLMKDINSIPLKPFEELPMPGTVCLAKCLEDSHICRAVVTNEVDSAFKIFYVDFGNTEVVPPENLFQITPKFIIPKVMATRLSLAGIEKSSMTLEMQCAFKQFVDNRLLIMDVLPARKKMSLPKCNMWDPETNVNVMDVLNRAAECAYPDALAIHKGFTQLVKVSFVHSCNRFYVQLKSKETELNELMKNLQTYCNSNQAAHLENTKVGQPCCALFPFDEQWYRSLVTEVKGNVIKVRYMDFGNEDDIDIGSLKMINGEYLTILRPQAIECCLNGYQNMTENKEQDNKLEELILEQEFTMKVIDTINNKIIVDLIDANNKTVSSLLLESMIAQPRQTTPTLETRPDVREKWSSPDKDQGSRGYNQKDYFQHDDRRPSRHQANDSSSWRQNPQKQNDETNDSWRQDNRGFRDRKDDWNQRSPTESNSRRERGGFRGRQENSNNNERPFRQRNNNDDGTSREGGGRSYSKPNRSNNSDNWDNTNSNTNNWNDNNEGSKNQNKEWENKDSWNQNRDQNQTPRTRNPRENNDWGANERSREFRPRKKSDDWNNKSPESDNWGENKGFKGRQNNDDWAANKGSSERKFGDRNREDRGNFKKKPFRREGSEISSSGSEKSFGKGIRSSSRNDNRPPRFDKKFANKSTDNSWNISSVPSVVDGAPNDAQFKDLDLIGRQEKVSISWFHNPGNFFCQLVDSKESFKQLMQDIQESYKGRPSGSCVKGAPVVGLFPEDNVLYRAKVLQVMGNQYKIYYVDFGNISIVEKVWPIENKFMEMPMQAIPCGLNGIAPIDADWPNPDTYSRYFERENLDCNFLAMENGRYFVDLTSENDNISQQLVNDSLAKYTAPIEELDISLLVGQQFRAMLKSVNNLQDFTILLQSGVTLSCSAHNLASATETYEDVLKASLEQILIVYVDDIVENRLEVTLYDSTGSKLNILTPDEGAFDTVDILCPYLVTKAIIHGFVPHVNETSVVIQPNECSERIDYVLEQMYEYYENLPPDNPLIPEEEFVYAAKSDDANWYRAKVTAFDNDKATVIYVDYGNTEQVHFSQLRELLPQFMEIEALAILVNVKTPTKDYLEREVSATIYYGDSGWEGEIQYNDVPSEVGVVAAAEEAPSVEFTEVSSQATEEINDSIPQIEETSSVLAVSEDTASSGIERDSSANVGNLVTLSHINSPSDFYIQLNDSIAALDELQVKLQEKIEEMAPLENPSVGGLCAAPYVLDQQWYRSQILDADDDITTVRFIDYGNTDVIDNKTTKIRTLPPDLLSLEEYATRCRLKIKPIDEDWSQAANERFQELTSVDNIKAEFLDQDEKTSYVELYSDAGNVKDILIKENLASFDQVVVDGKLTGFVSHMNSPSEFWIQLESCCAELEWIAEQLSNAASFPDLEDLTPGSLCAAMFPDDEMWYRARILSNTVAGIEVLFIDYGNSCACSNLKQLPEHLVMAPPLAQKCSLQKPDGLLNWSAEAAQKFVDISADGQTIFTVKKLTTGETSIVELLVDGEDVAAKLLPFTDNGYVTDIESTESFTITKTDGVVSDVKYELEKLATATYDGETVEKLKEICDEGKTLFEVEYLPNNAVRLYLNGRDIRKDLQSIKSLETKSQDIVPNALLQENAQQIADSLVSTIFNDAYSETSQKEAEQQEQLREVMKVTTEDNVQSVDPADTNQDLCQEEKRTDVVILENQILVEKTIPDEISESVQLENEPQQNESVEEIIHKIDEEIPKETTEITNESEEKYTERRESTLEDDKKIDLVCDKEEMEEETALETAESIPQKQTESGETEKVETPKETLEIEKEHEPKDAINTELTLEEHDEKDLETSCENTETKEEIPQETVEIKSENEEKDTLMNETTPQEETNCEKTELEHAIAKESLQIEDECKLNSLQNEKCLPSERDESKSPEEQKQIEEESPKSENERADSQKEHESEVKSQNETLSSSEVETETMTTDESQNKLNETESCGSGDNRSVVDRKLESKEKVDSGTDTQEIEPPKCAADQ